MTGESEATIKSLSDTEKLHSVFEHSNEVLFFIDIDSHGEFRFESVNKAFLTSTGLQRSHIEGKLVSQCIPEPSLSMVLKNYRKAIDTKDTVTWEEATEYPTGTKEGLVSITPLFDENDECYHLIGTVQDITESRNHEKELLSQIEFTDSVINSLADTFYIFDPEDGHGIQWNRSLEEISGYDAEYFRSNPPGNSYPSDEHPLIEKSMKEALETGHSKVELHYIIKDGTVIPFEYSVVTIKSPEGKQWMCAIGRDIRERKEAEDARVHLERQLIQAQKMESIGILAGGIAHDFNNILGVIIGNVELILKDTENDTPSYDSLKKIQLSSNRAKELVKQILSFSRQTKVHLIPIHLQSQIRESVKMLRSIIPTTVKISTDIDECCGVVMADPTQINQIIMNLCSNASDAIGKRGGEITISLKCDQSKSGICAWASKSKCIELVVTDNGCGIEPAVLDKIFDPYFTTKELGHGTGMGLAIIHGIVNEYGGDIRVESSVGTGTSVHITFPTVDQTSINEQENDVDVPEGTEKILLVDDEELLAEVGKKMLERIGYDVTVMTDSMDALDLFKEDPSYFDLVLSDVTMPDLNGIDLSYQLLKIRPDIPIILCTGYSNMIDEESARALGIKDLLMKPITVPVISKLIRKALG